jgi:hypothetical protein
MTRTSLKSMFAVRTLALAMLSAMFVALPARAQSESDLRRQNQELTSRVRDLEAELEAARKQHDALQKRIAALEAQLAAARTSGGAGSGVIAPLEEEPTTLDESKPGASPRAVFKALVESYAKAVGELPMGAPNDRDRIAYLRRLEKWEPAAEREMRSIIEWHVRALEPRMVDGGRGRFVTFVAVDPVTDTRLGDPFDVALTRPLATRLADLESRGDLGVLVLKGTLVTNVRINPARQSRGSFDSPRFIGPFAEFEFTVEPASITPVKPAATQPTTNPTP